MIVGTAGHVDHGKTSLVKALTGIDTDRLPEEKRRGITLELGFAHLALPDGTVAGVVDVPGHERFVKAMAAGAGGVDLALLVIAADEGVMPQTREHLDICQLLGVRAAVVALTKADLLTGLGSDWRGLLQADVSTLLAGTALETAEVVEVSARTGEGLQPLVEALGRAAAKLAVRGADGPLFLPVDRAFSLKGFGTVVTGTLLSGALLPEESVSLLPGLVGPFRARGIQVHGEAVSRAAAGQRTAVNLSAVAATEVHRGMVLTRFGELQQTRTLDVELSLLAAATAPLPRRRTLLLHLGTAQVEAQVRLLDVEMLQPGETALAQLRVAAPVAALPGQRFILRGPRPLPGRGATVAGGRILTLSAPRRRRGAGAHLEPMRGPDGEARVRWLLRQAGYRGLFAQELFVRASLSQKQLGRTLDVLSSRGEVLLVDKEKRLYLSQEVFQGLLGRALSVLQAFHEREPLKDALGREELRQRLSAALEPRVLSRLVQQLIERGQVEPVPPDGLRLRGRGRSLTLDEEAARSKAVASLAAAGLAPPTLGELGQSLALLPSRVTALLEGPVREGTLVKVTEELYFHAAALSLLRTQLLEHLAQHREISTQAFKQLVGQSRKFVIPLSEYFDREKVTLRVGEKRVARTSHH
ncbi:MAG: selenocysteine-specific translation elongation factor [Myxococcaceae bacterium]